MNSSTKKTLEKVAKDVVPKSNNLTDTYNIIEKFIKNYELRKIVGAGGLALCAAFAIIFYEIYNVPEK